MFKVKLTKDWEGKKAGTVVEITNREYVFPQHFNLEFEDVKPEAPAKDAKTGPTLNGG